MRAVRGAIYDVAGDLREGSPTRGRWFELELNAGSNRALFLSAGFAHGFVSLENESDVLYPSDQPHDAALDRGAR